LKPCRPSLHGTALGEKGIFSLERIREFFEKMKIPIEQIKIDTLYFNNEQTNQKMISNFYNLVRTWEICPAATIFGGDENNPYHVVTIDSTLPNEQYQAKNTSKNNKKITLSHYGDDINCSPTYDAIIISFKLDQSTTSYRNEAAFLVPDLD